MHHQFQTSAPANVPAKLYGADHCSMSCLNVSSSFPPMSRQIEVWAVSNLTFLLLSFTLLHSTTEVPFIVLANYSLESGTLKRFSGDATRVCACCAKMYLKHHMPSHKTTTLYTRLARGAPLLSRRILRVAVSLTLRNLIGRPKTKEQTFRKFNKKTKPQSNQQAKVASYHR